MIIIYNLTIKKKKNIFDQCSLNVKDGMLYSYVLL